MYNPISRTGLIRTLIWENFDMTEKSLKETYSRAGYYGRAVFSSVIPIFAVLLIVLLYGCQRDRVIGPGVQDEPPVPDTSRPIALSANITEASLTRGLPPIIRSNINNIGVFAGFCPTRNFGEGSTSNDYIDNSMFFHNDRTGVWDWSIPTYWPLTGYLSFFAYVPYSGTMKLADNHGYPSIQYTPTTDVANQVDFCLAEPQLDCGDRTDTVHLTFRHVLTGVRFFFNYTGSLPSSSYYVKIDRVVLSGLVGTKTVHYTGSDPYFLWDDDVDSLRTTSYTLSRIYKSANTQLNDDSLKLRNVGNSNHIQINPYDLSKGMLYLLPQKLKDASLSLGYGFYVMEGTGSNQKERLIMQFETEAGLLNPGDSCWTPGINVNYYATLDVGHSRILNIEPETTEPSTMIVPYDDTASKKIGMIE